MIDPSAKSRAPDPKHAVQTFWDAAACGEVYAVGETRRQQLEEQATARYSLEPFIFNFAHFANGAGKDVLEIGVGMGADHLEWAKAHPRSLQGIDLTPRAVEIASERLRLFGFEPRIQVGDAEQLPFADRSFDIVYSWGVLHHSPDTPRAVQEVFRVLRPGGRALVMVYQKHSIVGWLLWSRYALLRLRPWRSLRSIYAEHLESPGTKAYTEGEARALFAGFSRAETSVALSAGDLMEGAAGQRHGGALLRIARAVWPRQLVKRIMPRRGLFLMIDATK